MDRCKLAMEYHQKGFNCAQSVLAAFCNVTHLTEKEALAVSGGFGGGIGGSHEELCGAMSGAVMVLSMLYPHTEENDGDAKKRIYHITRDFQERFERVFPCTRCGDLLKAPIAADDSTPAAKRMEIQGHCAILIVTAVEIVENMLREAKIDC